MESRLWTVLLLVLVPMLVGMGNLGGVPEGRIPETEENIHARIVDRSGMAIEVVNFSIDGKVFVDGKRGEGELAIFFKDLRKIDFTEVRGEGVLVDLYLRTGQSLRVEVPKRHRFFGDAGYGVFRIRAEDVQSIEFPSDAEG